MSIKTDSVCGIIVAAGSGTRMGGVSKPEIKLDGKTLFQRVLEAFLASSVSELVVVGGENLPRLQLLAERYRGSVPIRFSFTVEGEQVKNLFSMTPHVFRISKAGAEALEKTETLTDTASCVLNVYRKV